MKLVLVVIFAVSLVVQAVQVVHSHLGRTLTAALQVSGGK